MTTQTQTTLHFNVSKHAWKDLFVVSFLAIVLGAFVAENLVEPEAVLRLAAHGVGDPEHDVERIAGHGGSPLPRGREATSATPGWPFSFRGATRTRIGPRRGPRPDGAFTRSLLTRDRANRDAAGESPREWRCRRRISRRGDAGDSWRGSRSRRENRAAAAVPVRLPEGRNSRAMVDP